MTDIQFFWVRRTQFRTWAVDDCISVIILILLFLYTQYVPLILLFASIVVDLLKVEEVLPTR